MSFVPLLLIIHVGFALGLLLPSIVLPFALRAQRPATVSASPLVRGLLVLQGRGTVVIGAGLFLSGGGLLLFIGVGLLSQPWLLVALTIYAANLLVAFFIQRPSLRRLLRVGAAFDGGAWADGARRQRYISYLLGGLTGAIGLLMSAKPRLW